MFLIIFTLCNNWKIKWCFTLITNNEWHRTDWQCPSRNVILFASKVSEDSSNNRCIKLVNEYLIYYLIDEQIPENKVEGVTENKNNADSSINANKIKKS